MEYTVQKLAELSGTTARTLRYYDEIGILKPARISSSGYRIYGKKEVDRLQQILFYKELGVSLEQIQEILSNPTFEAASALKEHYEQLLSKRKQLDLLIRNVEKTIAVQEGRGKMSDHEKFEGFKQEMIKENEEKFGKEIREKYGEENIMRSNEKVKNMTKEEYETLTRLETDYRALLKKAVETGDPAGKEAQEACELHKQWLSFYWPSYTKEAHAGLGDLYVSDDRFKANYDRNVPGTAEFFREAIKVYTGK
ncbi:MerR family transcriptional regulator [Metabacillus sp. GX 13764]|uniref:MerR family transcriptional regulator n=1 Tax=Metabacillus kandeliae TaxID=2900151 RepID=UPI001E487100|nr:MerR family transcriptional regulator [Metabacillus kandeliae]MCD7033605.1 MerR family transcriptional regulator [Metabacillus kandeliae]